MNTQKEVLAVMDSALGLNGRSAAFDPSTPLLGALPELDSMAVANLLTMLEERFGFVVEDDEIDGAVFTNVGSLVAFVQNKL